MTTVRFKFRPSVVDGKPGTVYYRISRKHQSKVFASNIRVESYYWSGNHPISAWLQARIKSDILCLKQIINLRTKENPDFCPDEIVDSFRHQNTHRGLLFFMNECITHLYSERRYGTARNYKSTFRSLAKFTGGCDVAFGSIDEGWLLRYQSWLKADKFRQIQYRFTCDALRRYIIRQLMSVKRSEGIYSKMSMSAPKRPAKGQCQQM